MTSDPKKAWGNNSFYLARRLATDAPEILAAWERGEIKNMREACRQAGIIKEPSKREKALRAFFNLSEKDKEAFLFEAFYGVTEKEREFFYQLADDEVVGEKVL